MRPFGLILAADLPTAEDNRALLSKIGGALDGVKVSVATLLTGGLGAVQRFRDLVDGRPVLLDLKIGDIGLKTATGWAGTNGKIITSLAGCGATHVTIHGFPGASSVSEAAAACRDAGLLGLLIPAMSHPGGSSFFSRPIDMEQFREDLRAAGASVDDESVSPRTVTDAILAMGEAFGLYGFIGPASRPRTLQQYRAATRLPVWCPGFGRQDPLGRSMEAQLRDWAASLGPQCAAIVGAQIYGAPDPLRAAEELSNLRDAVVADIHP